MYTFCSTVVPGFFIVLVAHFGSIIGFYPENMSYWGIQQDDVWPSHRLLVRLPVGLKVVEVFAANGVRRQVAQNS